MTPSLPIRSACAARSSVGSNTTRSGGDGSLTICRFLIKVGIDVSLERLGAGAVHDVDEALVLAVAQLEVGFDHALDHIRHVGARERGTDHLAKRRAGAEPGLTLVTANFDLVPLLAVLIDAEDADMPDVVVAAGVHAARDVQ